MKVKSVFLSLLGLLGIFSTVAPATGADILGAKLNLENRSFEETSHGTQDWTVGK